MTWPNHALQRTATAVTARASAAAFPPAMHGPRQPPPSLSLGSLGVATRTLKTLTFIILNSAVLLGCTSPVVTATPKDSDYSKRILGRWEGPRKFRIFHADGTWGVQRLEENPEDIDGRRWHIKGNKLFLTFRGYRGFETTVYTIVSFTPKSFTTEEDGHKELYERTH